MYLQCKKSVIYKLKISLIVAKKYHGIHAKYMYCILRENLKRVAFCTVSV